MPEDKKPETVYFKDLPTIEVSVCEAGRDQRISVKAETTQKALDAYAVIKKGLEEKR